MWSSQAAPLLLPRCSPCGGTPKPYAYLSDTFLPKLAAPGVDAATIDTIIRDNPFRAFARYRQSIELRAFWPSAHVRRLPLSRDTLRIDRPRRESGRLGGQIRSLGFAVRRLKKPDR